jgi:hypothetical protein
MGEKQGEDEEHEGQVVDETGHRPRAGAPYRVYLEAHERHRRAGD